MVVPYKQAIDFNDLTDEEMTDLLRLTRRCQNALSQLMKPDGFNIGINLGKAAGAGIAEHLHIHVVSRWAGDTNFMPVLGQTTVVPQALTDLAAEVQFAVGSGQRGRAYLIDHDGYLFASPLTWYPTKNSWDLSPGYEKRNARFTRSAGSEKSALRVKSPG